MKVTIGVVFAFGVVACGGGGNHGAAADAGGTDTGSSSGGDAAPSGDAGADVDNGAPSTTYPAFQPPVPQFVLASANGTVMQSPRVRPVYFVGDTVATDVDTSLTEWFASSAWTAETHEYGIGSATLATPVMLTETAATALTDAEIQTWLQGKLDGTHPEFGPVDGATLASEIFMVFYPATTTVTGNGETSCTDFDAYHQETAIGTSKTAYVVVNRCPGDTTQGLEVRASYETLATAGDPFPMTQAGYGTYDANHLAWNALSGDSELPGFCVLYDDFDDGGMPSYALSWSNAAMSAYHQPCVPMVGATPYFVSVPVMDDSVTYANFVTKGILVPVGQSVIVEVDLLSDGATSGPWTVAADVMSTSGLPAGALGFAFDRTTGTNGEKLHMTVTANQAGPTPFVVTSTLGAQQTFWAGLVGQK